jgi:macrolide-specific efflux system membrane fusion protein
MTVSTQVSEADVPKLRIGMDAYFTTLGNANRRFSGKLRQILPTPTVTNNVVLYTGLFDVANPNRQLMTQMTAQVFFVREAARDAITVPVAALRFGGGGADARVGRAQGGENNTANQAERGGRAGNGAGRAGRAGAGGNETAAAIGRPRAATLVVVKDDGMQETRNVTVGVTDRVTAEVLSGLEEGEKVLAGAQAAGARTARAQARPGGLGPPPGGFR